jgi:hypothetical protein
MGDLRATPRAATTSNELPGVVAPMKSLKRDIFSALLMCLIAVVIALAWGSPFIEATPAFAKTSEPMQQALRQLPPKAKPHPGIVSSPDHR